ncbi:hypothetical protein TWF730_003622 [Orbilia blumenaviensis]|uniref:F-box domain-containing protein n=1 Tax=Orbilia blumenaviensis TaxID=1796055 RepID=A0AAV9U6U7_9PEZI
MGPPEEICLINLLPTELLYRIFATIDDPKTLCRAERACHRWRSVIDTQVLWRNLATKLSSARILPERFNELGKGSLITGRYVGDEEGGRWNYMYRDLVRNIYSLNRISGIDYHEFCKKQSNDNPGVVYMDYGPTINQVVSSMEELSQLPKDYEGVKDAYVTRKIDFTLSSIEGMRLQPRPLQVAKTPAFTDSLCPGETEFEEAAWVYMADQLSAWPEPDTHPNTIFETPPAKKCSATLQKGVFRAGTNGVFGDGTWAWPPALKEDDEENVKPTEDEKGGPSSGEKKRPWKAGETTSPTSNRTTATINPGGPPSVRKGTIPDLTHPPGHIKWAAPVDGANMLPHARRWDPNDTIFGSYCKTFNLTPEQNPECRTIETVENIINTLYGEMCSQAHSDPNLRISYKRLGSSFPDFIAVKVDRLALPPYRSIKRDPSNSAEPMPVINQSWNLFGGAKWSLNSIRFLEEEDALKIDGIPNPSSRSPDEPWWTRETCFRLNAAEPPLIWETAHKWEYRSCGDYLIISDDVGMSGPCTISCFKTGYHKEKSTADAKTYLRGAAYRNYLAAGPSSDLIWQKSLKHSGYSFDRHSKSAVRSHEHPDFQSARPSYFLDNDGLTLNSKVVVYATRKKVFFTLDSESVMMPEVSGQTLTCMEFHIIAIETGQTINILDLEHEVRALELHQSWYGWTSFVMTDTHLMATVGGNIHPSEGAERMDDSIARTWSHRNRYGREEIFIWPLDLPNQNLSLAPEERKIMPTGRLAIGFNGRRWWQRDRFLGLSRDGRFLTAASKYTLVVWDLWLGDGKGEVYYFDEHSNGLQGYNLSKLADNAANGIWLQYRDIITTPTSTRSNPPQETELLRKVIFIPSGEIRLLIQGTKLDFETTPEGKQAAKDLESKLNRRYVQGALESESEDSSDSWETDNDVDGDYEDDGIDDSEDDYDSDGGGFKGNRFSDDGDWDDDGEYDEDYGDDEDDDDDDDDDDHSGVMQGVTVTRPSGSQEQSSNVRKRKLETVDAAAGTNTTTGGGGEGSSTRQEPVSHTGWGDEFEGGNDGAAGGDGWGPDNGEGGSGQVEECW